MTTPIKVCLILLQRMAVHRLKYLFNPVIVQLDEPLWVSVYASQEIAAEVMALCLQLDILILSSSQKVRSGYQYHHLVQYSCVRSCWSRARADGPALWLLE